MKWLVVFLIIVPMVMACDTVSDTANSADGSLADLEARIVRIEEALSPGLPAPWEPPREGLIDVGDLESAVDSLEDRMFYLEMGWR